MMKLGEHGRKCRVALIAIADRYSTHPENGLRPESAASSPQAFTLDLAMCAIAGVYPPLQSRPLS
jgi:hypothetical protein